MLEILIGFGILIGGLIGIVLVCVAIVLGSELLAEKLGSHDPERTSGFIVAGLMFAAALSPLAYTIGKGILQ